MEVSYPQSALPANSSVDYTSEMAVVDSMDVDMDIDLGPIDDIEVSQLPEQNDIVKESQGAEAYEISVQNISPTPHKIYIRGLDDLATGDLKAFSFEHFPSDPPSRVEWIDDTSANLVFETPAIAMKALESFTLPNPDGSAYSDLQLRPTKTFTTHPESTLEVRTALVTDQKRPRAHEASRFYMMHPEHDPREQRRKQHHNQEDYRRKRYGDEEQRRRRRKDREDGFDASMYDDNGPSGRRDSLESSSAHSEDRSKPYRSRGDSYRPARRERNGIARDRSASPGNSRQSPPPSYRKRDPHPFPQENKDKELFPSKFGATSDRKNGHKELFSNKLVASKMKKELFPQKANTTNHRRSDAFDAADETITLFRDGLSVEDKSPKGDLADRISNGNTSSSGRLKEPDLISRIGTKDVDSDAGLNIRGASSQNQGFSIRGSSAAGTIKELFPDKQIGNAGKELFAERLRGVKRNKAKDMFY